MKPIPLPKSCSSTSIASLQQFGTELLSSFKKFGYAYISINNNDNNTSVDLNQVRRSGRKILQSHFPIQSAGTDAVDSLRGFYRFRAASGRADDIRCFSVGNIDKTLGELRGKALFQDPSHPSSSPSHANSEVEEEISAKRNIWPQGCDPRVREDLESYYKLCSKISTQVATSIELALVYSTFREEATIHDAAVLNELNWPKWMSKEDNHLECKFYAGVDQDLKAVSASSATCDPQPEGKNTMKKSKILRRTKSSASPSPSSSTSNTIEEASTSSPIEHKLFDTRMDVHADLSVVTLLLQDNNLGGLEVFDNEEKKFVRVDLAPTLQEQQGSHDDISATTILVHAGMFLEKWSGGEIVATPHRIRTVQGTPDRCSIVFFAFPNFDANITPIDGVGSFVAGDEHPKV